MAYEALYRRYRPSRFQDAFFGQDHVVAALRNAIDGDRVGHAYLFSGPRGTGKTTSARILAKALNCTNLQGGEPCNECDSCLAFQTGGSYDLHELDAASNNGVEAMRDLIGKVALGSPGRTKVYILDEVHMLSSGAENALLKTLEEPPPHVVFVLCTTEPNKVVPTIRSRTQHLEFSLLSAAQVGQLVDHVIGDAGIEITPEDRQYVIRAGGGSARDTLSALDQVVAAGGAPQGGEHLEALFQSLIDRNAPAALAAIDGAMQAGRDPGQVGASLLHELRTIFLAAMRADLGHLPEAERDRATTRAADMPPARVTRAIEVIGTSLIEMRQAPDPRVDLEVAIMRVTRADLDRDPAALVERLEAIERQLAGGAAIVAAPQVASPQATPSANAPAAPTNTAPPSQVHETQAPANPAPVSPQAAQVQREQPYADQAPAHQAAPQAQATPPQAAPPQPAAPQPSGGRRGADLVRAELERQGIASAKPPAAAAPEPAIPPPAAAQPAAPAAAGAPAAPPSSGKTLADVRRERQAAAQSSGSGADNAEVEANAAARRERQAAAQEQGVVSEPPPVAQAQAAPVQPMPQAAPVQPVQQADHEPTEPAPQPQATPTGQPPAGPAAAPIQEAAPAQQPQPTAAGALPTLEELNAVWPTLLASVSNRVKSRFAAGHFVETTAEAVQFGLPNPVHRDRCEEIREEVDQVLATQFGCPIPLVLVVDLVEDEPDFFAAPPSGGAGAVAEDMVHEEDAVDVHSLVDATDDVPSAEDRVMNTFENSVLLEDPAKQQPHP